MSDPNIQQPVSTPSAGDTAVQTPAAATPAVPAAQSPAIPTTPTATPTTQVPPQQPNPNVVPSYRLREQRDQYEARIQQLQTQNQSEIDRLQKQIQALAGVTPQNQSQADVIREQLYQVVPDLKELLEMREQLKEVTAQREDFVQQSRHYWESYNRSQMDRLYKTFGDSYGQPLSDAQKSYLKAAFIGWASNDPELASRYQTDPSLVDEFAKEFSSSFVEPARRIATTQNVQRTTPALPQDTPSGNVRVTQPIDPPKDLDDRVSRAWQAFDTIKKGGGLK